MAEEVPGGIAERRSFVFGRPPMASKPRSFVAWLLVYGVYYTLWIISIGYGLIGPLVGNNLTWFGWILSYLITGALWGITFVPRRAVRSWLHLAGLKIKKSRRALHYKHEKFDFTDLSFFGPNLGLFLSVFLIGYLTFIFALFWPIAVLLEIALWADRSRP